MDNDPLADNKAEIEELQQKIKLEKGLDNIAAKKKINRDFLDKQVKYDRNSNFKNMDLLIENKKQEKFYFEFEKTPEERYEKKEENSKCT